MSSKDKDQYYRGGKMSENANNIILFWLLFAILALLTIGNLILNLCLIGALKIGRGMQNVEVSREMEMIKMYETIDLDRVYKKDGHLEGFREVPMSITGDKSAVNISLINRNNHNHNKFSISQRNGTQFKGINLFDMRDPTTYESIFLFNKPQFHLNNSLLNLEAHCVSTNRITSSVKESLHLQSRKHVQIKGIEGTYVDGKEMLITGDQNIILKSQNGSIILASTSLGGVYIDLRLLKGFDEFADTGVPQYKLCVCMPQGRIFRVQIPKTATTTRGICAISGTEQHPCNLN